MSGEQRAPARPGEALEQKAAKWDRIRAAWELYQREGAEAFDWDYDSRDLMRELTAEPLSVPAAQDTPED